MIAASSAGSFMFSRAAAAGAIARPNMARRQRFIIGSCAGRVGVSGEPVPRTGRVWAIGRHPDDRLLAAALVWWI